MKYKHFVFNTNITVVIMNIKNIKRYVKRTNLSVWTKYELFNARSYDEVKNVLKGEIMIEKLLLRNPSCGQRKICEKRIQQAENILRLMGY